MTTYMEQCRNPFNLYSLMFIHAIGQKFSPHSSKMWLVLSKKHFKIQPIFSSQIIHRPMHLSTLHTSEANNEPFTSCNVFLGHLPITHTYIRFYIIVSFIHCQFGVH